MSHLYVQLEQLEVKSNLRSKGCVVISHLCVQVEQLKVKYNYRSKGFHVMSHLCVQVEQCLLGSLLQEVCKTSIVVHHQID